MRLHTVAAACATAVVVSLISPTITPTPTASAAFPQVHVPAVQLSALAATSAPAVAQADPIASGLRRLSVQVGAWIWSAGDALVYPAVLIGIPALVLDPDRKHPVTRILDAYVNAVLTVTRGLAKQFGYPPAADAVHVGPKKTKPRVAPTAHRPKAKTKAAAAAPRARSNKGTGHGAPRGRN